MRVLTPTDLENGLDIAFLIGNEDSLLIDNYRGEAYLAFKEETGKKLVLSCYSSGYLCRSEAMNLLGQDYYGCIIDELFKANIPLPKINPDVRKDMVERASEILTQNSGDHTLADPNNTAPIELVLTDTGPLISLAKTNALCLLLAFKKNVKIIVTDYVHFEITRAAPLYWEASLSLKFFEENLQRIEVAETSSGSLYIEQYNRWKKYCDDVDYRETLEKLGDTPPKVPRDLGNVSVLSYVNSIRTGGAPKQTLVLAEDSVLLNRKTRLPDNLTIISTLAFLELLQRKQLLTSVSSVWDKISR